MKKILLCFLLSFSFVHLKAQKMSIGITGSASDFNYSTISDYENSKVLNNAIRLNIDSKKKKYLVYFRADGPIKMSTGQTIPEGKFGVRIHNTLPVIPLSAYNDQLLIRIDKDPQEDKGEVYFLDFIIAPLLYDYDPGYYTVNILFTLTSD